MNKRSTAAYEAVFASIETVFHLQPFSFMTDFEKGMRKAINNFYPEAQLHGCWFHFSRAIRAYALKLKLYQLIYVDEMGSLIFKQIKCIPLLPHNFIEDGFKIIKKMARDNGLYNNFKPLLEYFENFWLELVLYINIILLRFS